MAYPSREGCNIWYLYLSSHLKSEEEAQDDETEAIDTRDKNLRLVGDF